MAQVNRVKDWVADRLVEKGTWLGLVAIATGFGLALSPDQREAILQAGTLLGGLLAVVLKG